MVNAYAFASSCDMTVRSSVNLQWVFLDIHMCGLFALKNATSDIRPATVYLRTSVTVCGWLPQVIASSPSHWFMHGCVKSSRSSYRIEEVISVSGHSHRLLSAARRLPRRFLSHPRHCRSPLGHHPIRVDEGTIDARVRSSQTTSPYPTGLSWRLLIYFF